MYISHMRIFSITALLTLAFATSSVADSVWFYELATDTDPSVFSVRETWHDTGEERVSTVTDMDLILSIWGDGYAWEALTAPNGLSNDEWKWEDFSFSVDVVADGRMHREGWGGCIPWEDDIAWCSMDGDGGVFQVEREITDDYIRLSFILRVDEQNPDYRPSLAVKDADGSQYSASLFLPEGNEGRVTFEIPNY